MLQNIFTPSPWIWGGLIAGLFLLPILIHLINMMRHRRVKWAAMEFLLKSHRKHRNWVWLKQLLLLLSRIAALLLALFTLGQIGCNSDALSRFLGSRTTHHYVLLDDSYSMEESNGRQAAFDRARDVLSLIAARARDQQNQRFTLLRFSRALSAEDAGTLGSANSSGDGSNGDQAGNSGGSNEPAAQALEVIADINGQLVDSQFDNLLEEIRGKLQPGQLSVGPQAALQMAADLIESRPEENSWLYVVSDFRDKDWDAQPEVANALERLAAATAELEMIHCTRDDAANLAVTRLAPRGNVRVAGVPLLMEVAVQNLSTSKSTNVQVDIRSMVLDSQSQAGGADFGMDANELPTVFIEEIEPGETQVRTFPVFFRNPGQHVVQASLEQDAITSDNRRWDVIQVEPSVQVLLVDNDAQQNAPGLQVSLNPNDLTGIESELATRDFLRDSSLDKLQQYDVIFLLDVDRLDEAALRNLEDYVRSGGGCGIFVGPFANLSYYSQSMYRDGNGLLPLPLEKAIPVPEQLEERVPDFAIRSHPVFEPLLGMKNSPLDLVQISQVVRPPLEWRPRSGSTVEIAATLRGESNWPLVVTQQFGQGRVGCVLTTASPLWNNWARNATYPLTMLVMQDYLAAGRRPHADRRVGQRVEFDVAADSYKPVARLFAPSADPANRLESELRGNTDTGSGRLDFAVGGTALQQRAESARQGVYDLWLETTESDSQVRRFALNVDPAESDLAWMTPQKLAEVYADADPKISRWDQFSSAVQRNAASSLTKLLLGILVGILLLEQILAFWASYHARPSGSGRPGARTAAGSANGQRESRWSRPVAG